jgi:uncharacterized protein HemX
MKPLEDELRRSLRRLDVPAGFANRVMARVEQQAAAKPGFAWYRLFRTEFWARARAWAGQRAVLSLAATAAVLVLAVSFVMWRQHRIREEQRQGELARAQVMEALHITSVKLHLVRTRVREATQDGVRLRDQRRTKSGKPEALLDLGSPILD